MEKEFVPYTEALALKELGFDEKCLMYWNDYGKEFKFSLKLLNRIDFWSINYIEAPTYSQAFRWFREKYNLISEILWTSALPTHNTFTAIIKSEEKIVKMTECDIYEEAELECLKKLIEIVKDAKK